MRNRLPVRLVCSLLLVAMCLCACVPAVATGVSYTMAEKLYRQLWGGSGFGGTLEVALSANPDADGAALVTEKPLRILWDYLYVRPTAEETARHWLELALVDEEAEISNAGLQLKDGVLVFSCPLLGEDWWQVDSAALLADNAAADEGTLAAQLLPGVQDAVAGSTMPAIARLLLPQLLRWQENEDGLEAIMEQMTLRMDLWIEGYRQNAELGRLQDGSPVVTVTYQVGPDGIKAQVKQLVLEVLGNEEFRGSLANSMNSELARLLLNPAFQPYYFAAIDQLPLQGDLLLSRTLDMEGQTVALELSLPFHDAEGGDVTLLYRRARGEGDLPDSNTIAMEGDNHSATLTYLTYRSLTDVTVYQGTLHLTGGQNARQLAFTLSHQASQTSEDGIVLVYDTSWQLQLSPDPNGDNPQAFAPLQLQLDGIFTSKTLQTAVTHADLTLTLSGEERPQTATLHFQGETRRTWQPEPMPQQRRDLLALDGAELEELLATLLTEGSQLMAFLEGCTRLEAPADEGEATDDAATEAAAPADEGEATDDTAAEAAPADEGEATDDAATEAAPADEGEATDDTAATEAAAPADESEATDDTAAAEAAAPADEGEAADDTTAPAHAPDSL